MPIVTNSILPISTQTGRQTVPERDISLRTTLETTVAPASSSSEFPTTGKLMLEKLTTEDLTTDDFSSGDLATEDLATRELAMGYLATEDHATGYHATDDHATGYHMAKDMTENLATKDLMTEELETEDLETEDLTTKDHETDLTTEDLEAEDLTTEDHETDLPTEDLAREHLSTDDEHGEVSSSSRSSAATSHTTVGVTNAEPTTEDRPSTSNVHRQSRATNYPGEGTLETNCELEPHHVTRLESAFSRLSEGRGLMVHKGRLAQLTGVNGVYRAAPRDVSTTSTCPYTLTSVSLPGSYPDRLMNATCNCENCGPDDGPIDLPKTTKCQPLFYHVPVIRFQTVSIDTRACAIKDFTVEFEKIATGCTCVQIE